MVVTISILVTHPQYAGMLPLDRRSVSLLPGEQVASRVQPRQLRIRRNRRCLLAMCMLCVTCWSIDMDCCVLVSVNMKHVNRKCVYISGESKKM